MEILKRKISLEDSTDRSNNSKTYGSITASTFNISVFLTQTLYNIGIFDDVERVPSVDSSINDFYTKESTWVTGITSTKIDAVRTYNSSQPFKVGLDVNSNNYVDVENNLIIGVSKILSIDSNGTKYVVDANKNDIKIGTTGQTVGISYNDLNQTTRFGYKTQGLNQTNTSLSGLTKQEHLIGISDTPKVSSDIFIERPITKIYENHFKISEITNLDDLIQFQDGYFNIIKN